MKDDLAIACSLPPIYNIGLLRRLQQSTQPVKDGGDHVIVLCETIEAVFRKGLKRKLMLRQGTT